MYKFTWPVSYLPWSQSWRRDPEPVPVQRQSSGVLPVPVRGRYGWISMLLWLFLIFDDTAQAGNDIVKISRRGVDTGTDGSAAEVYCIHFSAHVSEAQDVSFDHGSVSVEGLAETHGNGIPQLCTTHFDHIDKSFGFLHQCIMKTAQLLDKGSHKCQYSQLSGSVNSFKRDPSKKFKSDVSTK